VRSLAAALREAMFSAETDVVPLALLTISHPSLGEPIRLCSDAASETGANNITRGGELFVAYPFDLVLPTDLDDQPPRARLTVDNIAREIVQLARVANPAPTVLMEIINAAAPDEQGAVFGPFRFGAPEYDDYTVTTDLVIDDHSLDAYPHKRYTAEHFPALFRQLA
jgi:hypothetical protein